MFTSMIPLRCLSLQEADPNDEKSWCNKFSEGFPKTLDKEVDNAKIKHNFREYLFSKLKNTKLKNV